jgi:WD40 repeat protein
MDGIVSLLDYGSWKEVRTVKYDSVVTAIALSSDESRILIATGLRKVGTTEKAPPKLDMQDIDGKIKETVYSNDKDGIIGAAFSADGQSITVVLFSGQILTMDVTGKKSKELYKHIELISALQFSQESRGLGLGSFDGMVTLYDIKADETRVVYRRPKRIVKCLSFLTNQSVALLSVENPFEARSASEVVIVEYPPKGKATERKVDTRRQQK